METNQPNQQELVFPVPNIIEIPGLDRRSMDQYVHDFGAHQYGYRIRIAHSHDGSHVCHYECYRGGYPSGGPDVTGTTRSLRIGCNFKISTRFLPDKSCWLLIHTQLTHNHPPDSNVKPRKRTIPPKPILPHPYHLTPKDTCIADQHITSNTIPTEILSSNPSSNPSCLPLILPQETQTESSVANQDELTTLNLLTRLQSLSPNCRKEAVKKIDAILTEQEALTTISHQRTIVTHSPTVIINIKSTNSSPDLSSPKVIINIKSTNSSPDPSSPKVELPELVSTLTSAAHMHHLP